MWMPTARTSRSGSWTASWRFAEAPSATRARSSTSSPTSPTTRRWPWRWGSGTTSTCPTSKRTCSRRSTGRLSCSRNLRITPWSGCCCASSETVRAGPRRVRLAFRSDSSHNPPPTIGGMCGIVGYVGPRQSQAILLAGLSRLEYRGYDSAGIAVIDGDGGLGMRKRAGKLGVLRDDLKLAPLADGTTGIGHTRWATHGGPTDANAHLHLADHDKLAVIHNGIIENFSEIKAELVAQGYTFRSETDTEVAAVLLGREYESHDGDLV